MTPEEMKIIIQDAIRTERERCLVQVEREKHAWHFTSSSKAVKTACDHIISMIRGDK